jgi:hypothetical protein
MALHNANIRVMMINPLNAELNPIRHLLVLAGAHHFVHVSRVRVKEKYGISTTGKREFQHSVSLQCKCRGYIA